MSSALKFNEVDGHELFLEKTWLLETWGELHENDEFMELSCA